MSKLKYSKDPYKFLYNFNDTKDGIIGEKKADGVLIHNKKAYSFRNQRCLIIYDHDFNLKPDFFYDKNKEKLKSLEELKNELYYNIPKNPKLDRDILYKKLIDLFPVVFLEIFETLVWSESKPIKNFNFEIYQDYTHLMGIKLNQNTLFNLMKFNKDQSDSPFKALSFENGIFFEDEDKKYLNENTIETGTIALKSDKMYALLHQHISYYD